MLMILVMATVWLVTTQSGLRWAYHLALPYLPTNISLEQIEGRLLGPIKFDAIKYEQDGTDIQAKQLIVNYQLFKLLAGRVDVTQLDVQSLRIMLAPGEKSTEPFQLPEISLPWRVTLSDVVINDIQISQKEETIALQQL
ncbi:MAG: hypothetical protein OEX19_05880, partial [Gammaproteobacteria bacterium]|nr:hypothetical protein [Gammaproteobacteria bacterium]